MAKTSLVEISEISRFVELKDGAVIWKPRSREFFQTDKSHSVWNARFAGKVALSASNGAGYLRGMINNRKYFAHRVIWALHYGKWPSQELDHINGDRTDNRICNLREVDRAGNARNIRIRKDNKSGAAGVFKVGKKYAAYIRSGAHRVQLGRHDTLEEAIKVRKKAEAEMGFHPNHGDRLVTA